VATVALHELDVMCGVGRQIASDVADAFRAFEHRQWICGMHGS
jgi:hypothetical protein